MAKAAVTSGANPGTGGWPRSAPDVRDLRTAYLFVVPVTSVVVVVNALTNLSDIPDIATWEPWVWEISSAISILVAMLLPWLATAAAPPDEAVAEGWRPKARFVLIHLAALLVFSAVHVIGFVALRKVAYDLMGAGPYEFGDRFIYELRKDLISYGTYVATFWLIGHLRRRRDEPVRPVSFDIRDGGRILRVPLSEIVAVSSAGNYAEFWLVDGRRPLMRTTLAAVEVELGGFGFVRAHRSWLVNARRVKGLRPDGSGDWTVELGVVDAPLSRRYPQALERLKTPA
ncbi:LytTR family DNA-binding domain-containing protein [Brevundimonas sp.]|uniref:LytTR family DNA-binding domain-containing protein n=1 Tax=Brevundimonas sp. TaxID=1871086 RepID=UPI002D6D1CCB|nr:LytTR family DNA-binding domain-containing protein [Brevundimonas sp.]HYC98869.1 LytTR family DNA-binding domain-containing protein [Brevundimonas sp.]